MRKRVLTALCLVACCALMIACHAEDAADTAAPTAAPKGDGTIKLPKVELYAEDNVPYAYVEGEYAPLLLSRDAIDSKVDAEVEIARMKKGDAFDEEALRASLEAQIAIPEDSYVPTIKPYLVKDSKAAVILFPGGGYLKLSKKNEGGTVAMAFNKKGISAFVVSYRVAPCDWRAILSDGRRAVRYVRWHAQEYGVDPDRIAVCGFSQGGHLALMTCQHPEFEIDDPLYRRDAVDEVSSLPNACILCYGVVTLEKGHTFEIGAEIFTGGDDSLRAAYSAENGVTPDMCPVFIWLNRDDKLVPPEGAFWLAEACAAQDVPYEMHVFGSGGHGCGLGKGLPCQKWMSLACSWLNRVL